ncbi:hypothetical protein [Duganella vulcania]|uniref:Uncharacterized protein n=1 Tax=Duganella vulcania TaxID=2692166 RepID=A0A845GFG1_9BURK|nr:hypothetical protein [Duganella vulcania]MYM92681.1 hypothetical protein [Duganella vulcania]
MEQATNTAANATNTNNAAPRTPPYAQVASAVRRLFTAAGANLGVDCLDHAMRAVALFKSAGFSAEVKIGYAAWRVGPGDGDMIVHAPMPGMVPQGPNAHPFHAWVELSDSNEVFDPTLYQLPRKARALDMLDGGSTTVAWAPDYLVTQYAQVKSLRTVTNEDVGMFYYQHVPALQAAIMARTQQLDAEEMEVLELVFSNPALHVVGPNNAKEAAARLAA